MSSKEYRKGYQSGARQGFSEGWVAGLDAVTKPNGRKFYCLVCGKALRPDNRNGRHAACQGGG